MKPPKTRLRKVYVFDFDDTLVKTDSLVRVKPHKGDPFVLTPGEFAVYDALEGDVFDYSDFELLINPREIEWTNALLKQAVQEVGKKNVAVLSARTSDKPIKQYLKNVALHGVKVVALGSSGPSYKSAWINDLLKDGEVGEVVFFDDAYRNIAAVKALQKTYADVVIDARHVPHVPSKAKR